MWTNVIKWKWLTSQSKKNNMRFNLHLHQNFIYVTNVILMKFKIRTRQLHFLVLWMSSYAINSVYTSFIPIRACFPPPFCLIFLNFSFLSVPSALSRSPASPIYHNDIHFPGIESISTISRRTTDSATPLPRLPFVS